MATRIILARKTAIGTTDTIVDLDDGGQKIQPPSGIKWTAVEARIGLSAAGKWKGFFDTENIWTGRQEIDFQAKQHPHYVTLDIVQPHFLQWKAVADSGTLTAIIETIIEESPIA